MNTLLDFDIENGWGQVDWSAKLRQMAKDTAFSTVLIRKSNAERLADELDRLYAIENRVAAELIRAECHIGENGAMLPFGEHEPEFHNAIDLLRQRGLLDDYPHAEGWLRLSDGVLA